MKDERPSLADAVQQLGRAREKIDGAPPDVARLLAWRHGELPPEEAQAVEERLAWSREDARLLADWQDFSTGEAPALAESDLDAAWQRFAAARQDEVAADRPADRPAPLPFERPRARPASRTARRPASGRSTWISYLAVAALLLVTLAGGLSVWKGRRIDREREHTLAASAHWPTLDLFTDSARSGAAEPVAVTFEAEGVNLVLRPTETLAGRYTLRIRDAEGREERREEVDFTEGRAVFRLLRGDLPAGRYTIEVLAEGLAPQRFEIDIR